jgi:hypothetical protein
MASLPNCSFLTHKTIWMMSGMLVAMWPSSQARVSCQGLPGSGVELVCSGSPEFRAALAKGIDPAGLAALRPVEPWLVLVKNSSTRALVAVMIRYERVSASGQSTSLSSLWLTTQNIDRRKAHPGQSILMGPFGGFSRVLRERLVMVDAQGASMDVQRRAAEVAGSAEIRILLDAVVFDDGVLVGPDNGGLQAELRSYIRAERELHENVLAMSGEARREYLAGISERTDVVALLADNSPEALYKRHLAVNARILLSMLDRARNEEEFLIRESQVVGSSIPEPRKEN